MIWYKATEDGQKGEQIEPFKWGTTLEDQEPGDYYIEYWINDKSGNRGTAHRIVTLQDTTPPTVKLKNRNGTVLDWGYYSYDLYVEIEDVSGYTALLNGEPYVSGTRIANRENYTLVATDTAGNSVTKEFGIDKDKPRVSGVSNNGEYTEPVTITVTDLNLDTVTLNGQAFVSGTEVSSPGTYTLIAKDKANNTTTIKFTIL